MVLSLSKPRRSNSGPKSPPSNRASTSSSNQAKSRGSTKTAVPPTKKNSRAGLVVMASEKGKSLMSSVASSKSSSSQGSIGDKGGHSTHSPSPSYNSSPSHNSNDSSKEFPLDKEVDFFSNPTSLSRLIQNQKFSSAIARLDQQGPAEASIWVCTKRKIPVAMKNADTRNFSSSIGSSKQAGVDSNDDAKCTFRQLPIHMACGSLFRVEDPYLRHDLEQLIARLVIAHPEGCARRDHQGRFPLHECIWFDAPPTIISALLMAAPDIARVADKQGVTPEVLNEQRKCKSPSHKKMVRGMLKKSPEFWHTARKEAELRMKHRDIPNSDATITSTSVLASSVTDEETILSNDKKGKLQRKPIRNPAPHQSPSKNQQVPPSSLIQPTLVPQTIHLEEKNLDNEVKPMAWEQLEKRAVALEKKLAESYEHIYALNKQLTELRGAKSALQAKVDKFTSSDMGKRVVELERQKEELQFHLARSKAVLARHGISLEAENNAEGMPPLPPLRVSFGTVETVQSMTDEEEVIEEIIEEEVVDEGVEDEDEDVTIEEIIEDEDEEYDQFDGSAEQLSQDQQRLALLKEQLQTLTNNHMDYQDRMQANYDQQHQQRQQHPNLSYSGDVVFSNDHDDHSEVTMDFTTMTPASRFRPQRPEPEEKPNSTGDIEVGMSKLTEESDQSSQRSPSVQDDQVGPLPSLSPGRDNRTMSGHNSALSEQSTTDLDSVIAGAMQLNGGQGLSPELIAMWKATSVGSAGPSINELAERYMEENSCIDSYVEPPPLLTRRPAADNVSLI